MQNFVCLKIQFFRKIQDDTPLEANLLFTCRKTGTYRGKDAVDAQRIAGSSKRLVFLALNEQIPMWGLETLYRNGVAVGHLRRAEYAHFLQKSIGLAYLIHPEGKAVDNDFILSGKYEIDVMGKRHAATCSLRSPFDPKNDRLNGIYN